MCFGTLLSLCLALELDCAIVIPKYIYLYILLNAFSYCSSPDVAREAGEEGIDQWNKDKI